MGLIQQKSATSLYRSFLKELPPIIVTRPTDARFKQLALTTGKQIATSTKGPGSSSISRTFRLALHEQLRQYLVGSYDHNGRAPKLDMTHFKRANQAVRYLEAQRTYVELLERYNPGLSEEADDRIRRTARRVGLETTL